MAGGVTLEGITINIYLKFPAATFGEINDNENDVVELAPTVIGCLTEVIGVPVPASNISANNCTG
jgi:hypothetical protein